MLTARTLEDGLTGPLHSPMKILLIKPPEAGLQDQSAYPPLGLMYLASALDKYSYFEPQIHLMEDMSLDAIPLADVYGINVHSPGVYNEVKEIADFVGCSGKPVCVGGAFPTSAPEFFEDQIVFKGESEFSFLGFLRDLEAGKDKKIYTSVPCEKIDDLPFPARHLLPDDRIVHTGGVHHSDGVPSTTVLLTRGCPFSCAFCDREIMGRNFRARSVSNIQAELKHLIQAYQIGWFRFPDDNLLVNKVWFNEFLDMIERLNVKWTCLARASDLDAPTAHRMKKSGCEEIFFGIETGSDELLKKMNKKSDVLDGLIAIERCKLAGIKSCAYMMFGFPGENEQTVADTMNFLKASRPDKSRISTFLPVPGSDVYNNPEKYGVKLRFDPDNFWYFDEHEFALDYTYIGNDRMSELRNDIMNFYVNEGYKDGWNKSV